MFVFDLVRRHRGAVHLHSLLVLEHILDSRPLSKINISFISVRHIFFLQFLLPGVDHVGPVFASVGRQFLPSLDYEDTGVTDLAYPRTPQLETTEAVLLVFPAVCKPRAET